MDKDTKSFTNFLRRINPKKERALLATFRRGLGEKLGTFEMYQHLSNYLPDSEFQRRWYFLTASLFALHPKFPSLTKEEDTPEATEPKKVRKKWGESMGAVFRRLKNTGDFGDPPEALNKRFQALLRAHEDDMDTYLRQSVSLAKSKDVPVDYEQLLSDLLNWSRHDKHVQYQWAKDYWRRDVISAEAEEASVTNENEA